MKRVPQLDENGCGIACVAMLANVSYDEARRAVGSTGNTTEQQLRKALANFGINLGQRIKLRSQTFSDLKQDGLLSARITTIKANDSWSHWLAWDAASQAVIDPRNDGIPSRRTRITSYFPISRQGS